MITALWVAIAVAVFLILTTGNIPLAVGAGIVCGLVWGYVYG